MVTLEIIEGPDYRRDEDGWEHNAYTVELTYDGRTERFPWRAGLGITEDPSAEDVLEALLMDMESYDAAETFEEWADNYGFDTDSRKAEAMYRATGEQTRQLRRLLGIGTLGMIPGNEQTETIARRLARGLNLSTGL